MYARILIFLFFSLASSFCDSSRSEPDGASIEVTGNIELTEVRLAFEIPGTLVALDVEEGDFVDQGKLIARLDADQLEKQRDQALASLRSTRAQKEELLAFLDFQKHQVQARINQGESAVASTQAALQKTRKGPRAQEIEEARARLQSAETSLEKAEKDWRRAQDLMATEDISQSQYDQFKAAFESSRATVIQAEQQLDLLNEGSRSEDIAMAEAAVASAKAGLELARTGLLEVRKTETSLKTVQAEIDRAEASLALTESRLRDTRLYSPISGVVLVKPAENGEAILAGATVAVLGDLDRPWIRGYVQETDLGRVKIGNRVRIRTDSFPEKEYWGQVSFIASKAEFTPKQIQTPEERVKLVYRIKIDILNEDQELKLNMPVDAEILLDEEVAQETS